MSLVWQRPPVPLVEGMTERVRVRLRADGAPVLIFGLTAALFITDKDGGAVSTVGKVFMVDDGVTAAYKGVLEFRPTADDWKVARSPYTMRAVLTDANGNTAAYPRSIDPVTFEVGPITDPPPVP